MIIVGLKIEGISICQNARKSIRNGFAIGGWKTSVDVHEGLLRCELSLGNA
jgi:hypothetical protein